MDISSTQLESLLANSRANEAIAKKLFEIETAILACHSSDELLTRLLHLIKDKFSLNHICLLVVEPSPIDYLFRTTSPQQWQHAECLPVTAKQLTSLHANEQPLLTNDLSLLANQLPENILTKAKSVALTPLKLEGKLFASLLFTDSDSTRFTETLGTFHLEQLAVKISLCLANVLIREQLEYMANYDRLTGVANRRLMEACINEELMRQSRYQIPFSVLFIDCNKFKQINDTYGHDCGDKVLTYVANQIQALIRENDKCFRYAGDEFVVTLSGQNYDDAVKVANRLTHHFNLSAMPHLDDSLNVTVTCGVAASNGQQTMDELLKAADQSLYALKKNALKSS